MEEKQISWLDLLTVASGVDSDGLPCSAGTLAIDKIISNTNVITEEELFLEMGTFEIRSSGGAAVVTIDFPGDKTFVYRKGKRMCENWLKNLHNDETETKQFSLCIVPFVLEGQIIVVYNQLLYVDGYEMEGNHHRLILVFDNNSTTAIEAEDIDYNAVQLQITEELRAYEQQIDEELAQLTEEENKLKEEENIVAMGIKEKLNNPLSSNDNETNCSFESEGMRSGNEDVRFRFSNDDE